MAPVPRCRASRRGSRGLLRCRARRERRALALARGERSYLLHPAERAELFWAPRSAHAEPHGRPTHLLPLGSQQRHTADDVPPAPAGRARGSVHAARGTAPQPPRYPRRLHLARGTSQAAEEAAPLPPRPPDLLAALALLPPALELLEGDLPLQIVDQLRAEPRHRAGTAGRNAESGRGASAIAPAPPRTSRLGSALPRSGPAPSAHTPGAAPFLTRAGGSDLRGALLRRAGAAWERGEGGDGGRRGARDTRLPTKRYTAGKRICNTLPANISQRLASISRKVTFIYLFWTRAGGISPIYSNLNTANAAPKHHACVNRQQTRERRRGGTPQGKDWGRGDV